MLAAPHKNKLHNVFVTLRVVFILECVESQNTVAKHLLAMKHVGCSIPQHFQEKVLGWKVLGKTKPDEDGLGEATLVKQ